MKQEERLYVTPEELIDAVGEDKELTPAEKETIIKFAKCDDEAKIYTEEAGLMRRLLKHPEFGVTELRVTADDAWGRRLSPDEWSGGTITGVDGFLPVGALKVSARSRSTSRHASIVSKEVRR